MRKLRSKLTYANVISTLCLFLILAGGAAYGASQLARNSVGTKQLKKRAVTTAKIKNEAVTAAKVRKGTLTGAQIDASTLGTVPSATNAANAGQAATASIATTARALSPPEPVHFVGAPGEPQFENGYVTLPTEIPAGFWMDHDCMVHLMGGVVGESENTAFTLPHSYRPFQESNFAAIRPTTEVHPAWVVVEPETGEVRLYFGSA
jgi:hypothetical protein